MLGALYKARRTSMHTTKILFFLFFLFSFLNQFDKMFSTKERSKIKKNCSNEENYAPPPLLKKIQNITAQVCES